MPRCDPAAGTAAISVARHIVLLLKIKPDVSPTKYIPIKPNQYFSPRLDFVVKEGHAQSPLHWVTRVV